MLLARWLRGLRWRLAATWRLWRLDARPDMPLMKPEPLDKVPRGLIDSPEASTTVGREMLEVRGWAVFPSGPTARIEVWLGEESLGFARVGAARPDLEGLTENPHSLASGFDLTADLSEWQGSDGPTLLRVIATSATGTRQELDPVQVTVLASEGRRQKPGDLPPPAPTTPRSPIGEGRRLLVCTHQLNLGGAQLYLLDLLSELIRQRAAAPTVVSAMDGPLRRELEELGVPTHISSLLPLDDLSSHIGRVEELAAWASDRDFEVALINTATALTVPGAEAAAQLGIPAIWAIHESFPPAVLWAGLTPEIRERAERALAKAAVALFEAEATQRLFESKLGDGRSLVLPYGVDLEPIDAARGNFDRVAARREAGIPEDAEVVLCVGTVEPRKAQLPLAQAFGLIADRHPRARLVFVGGRDDADSQALSDFIEATGGDRIELIPVTPDVQPWYGLADMLVCASDIESLPRTVLEAMALETPVLATSVFGLPELIEDGKTGWLCEPRDTVALAEALDRALNSTPEERRGIGEAARRLVERRHALDRYGRDVGHLLDQAATGEIPDLSSYATAR